MKRTFVKESFFSVARELLFAFHERPDAFQLLTPASAGVEIHSVATTLEPSQEVVRFTTRMLGLPFHFEMVHTEYDRPALFVDEQRKGLFRSWRHEHRFRDGGWQGDQASVLSDRIEFSHPLAWLLAPFVRHKLRAMFAQRHATTHAHTRPEPLRGPNGERLRVVVTGATGLIGTRLVQILVEKGAKVVALVRSPRRASARLGHEVELETWDFHHPELGNWRQRLGETDAVVHLAGTPLFSRRWTASFKREMERSRVESTRQLVEAMREASRRPRCFVSASAIGIYGTDPDLVADEQTSRAEDTLARICTAGEAKANKAAELGIRTTVLRSGIVLDRRSGALKEMLPLFALGLGGVLGAPRPWVNWIHLEDTARLYLMAMLNPAVQGPLNAVAPTPVPNQTLARTLARVLGRPCLWRYPTWLLRLAIGEAGEFAAGGARVSADHALSLGYRFFYPELEPALRAVLER